VNSVNLIGRLTRDVEIRYTPNNGTPVSRFTIAVNRINKDEADFISCVAFGKTAENLANYMRKGNQIAVSGSIRTRNYENNEGKRVYVTEVIANRVMFLERKKEDSEIERDQFHNEPEPYGYGGNQIDISDDDLPF